MNSITAFDIRLDKDIYYFGENILGEVILENSQNIQINDIRVILRGKANINIKLNRTDEKRIIKDNQYILNEKLIVWDKENCDEKNDELILCSGLHHFPFQFQLPFCSMPCSLETESGTIRYYIKVIVNIPNGSIPQGIKYFTIIGPSIDCMDEKYCCALLGQNKQIKWQNCCKRGALALRIIMDRTAYLCGENVRILAHVENRQNGIVWIVMRLTQHVEYFIEKIAGENKQIDCIILENKTLPVQPYTQGKFDTAHMQSFILPVVPPTLIGVCRLLQIFYVFTACIEDEKGNESLQMEFPLIIATLPFRKATMPIPTVNYDICCPHVEGGRYISPEFQIDYEQNEQDTEKQAADQSIVLYRPVYVCIGQNQSGSNGFDIDKQHSGHSIKKSVSTITNFTIDHSED